MTYCCVKHNLSLETSGGVVNCPECECEKLRTRIVHVKNESVMLLEREIVTEDIPDWLADELKSVGDEISRVAEASMRLESGYGPSHVVAHVLLMLLRLTLREQSDAVQLLHSSLDLAAEQYRREQN